MLDLKELEKSYGELKAVNKLSLHIDEGETVVVMGPSGCGKSTTIKCINRLTEPDGGQIIFRGRDIVSLPFDELRAMRREIGFVFQHFNLIQRLTACENVMFGSVLAGLDKEEASARAIEALTKVGLKAHADKLPSQMSGGQQQRVGIARAIASQPALMLWDEPTASLDPMLVREVLEIMEDLAKNHNSTMLVVTHELSFALHVADRIVLMDQGRIVEEGAPQEVFVQPKSAIGEEYRRLIEYQLNTSTLSLGRKTA